MRSGVNAFLKKWSRKVDVVGAVRSAAVWRFLILASCVSITATGCEPGRQADTAGGTDIADTIVHDVAVRIADSAGVRIVETLRPKRVETSNRWRVAAAPEVRIGSAFDERTMLAKVAGIAYGPHGEIIVADAQALQIKTFSAIGEPLWRQGRVGDGPGEYRGLRTVEHCGGHVLVADLQSRRLTLLDGAGEVATTQPWHPLRRMAAPFRLSCNTGGMLVQVARASNPPAEGGRYTAPAVVGVGRVGGERPEPVLEIPGIDRYRYAITDGPADFGKTTWAIASRDGVIVVVSDTTEFRTYDAQGTLQKIARWEHAAEPVTGEVLRSEVSQRERVLPRPMREDYRELWLSLDHPAYLPAIDTVVPDADGGFWARRFELSSERGLSVEWWRVGQDGVLRGVVEVPNDFTLFRVVPGAVLGVVRDSLGVEYVEKRRVHEEHPSG